MPDSRVRPPDFRQAPIGFRVAHPTEGIDVNEALKEVEQRQLLALRLAERVLETVTERRGQRSAAALACFVPERGLPGARTSNEAFNLLARS
jgi:hypothetical protein